MFHNQREAQVDFASVVGQGVVSTAGSTTVHGELERLSPSFRKKANFTWSGDHKISGELENGTIKGEHDNILVMLVEQHGGPQAKQSSNCPAVCVLGPNGNMDCVACLIRRYCCGAVL